MLVILVGAALAGGIYAMIYMLGRNDRADRALELLAATSSHVPETTQETLVDPWGNVVSVVSGADNFSITYQSVPVGACKHIAKHFDRTNPAYVSLSVNGTVFVDSAEDINAQTIADACGEKENALMIWTFSRSL